jgi:hypothetical protein
MTGLLQQGEPPWAVIRVYRVVQIFSTIADPEICSDPT